MTTSTTPTTFDNLGQLLDHFGAETPYQLGRSLYKATDCGPWITFVCEGSPNLDAPPGPVHVYYEDRAADLPADQFERFHGRCTAVMVGSIVEGSDVEVGPEILSFPFTSDQFDQEVQAINDEAVFCWNRDNGLHGVWHHNVTNEEHHFLYTWGDIVWADDGKPEPLITDKMREWLADQPPGEAGEQVFDTDAGPIVLTLHDTSDWTY